MAEHIPMPPRGGQIPILGQPNEVSDWFLAFNYVCKCQPGGTLLLAAGRVGIQIKCPKCSKIAVLTAFRTDETGGLQMNWQIGVAMTEPSPN